MSLGVHEPVGAPADRTINAWMEDRLRRAAPAGPVLDLGCGGGFWLRRMRAAGYQAVGVEPATVLAAAAAQAGPALAARAEQLPFPTGVFGSVWCIHILHHTPAPAVVLAEVRRVLRPGGTLLLAETVEDNPFIRAGRSVFPRWDGAPVLSRFTAAELDAMLAQAGFTVGDRRRHSLVAFAAYLLPCRQARAWARVMAWEQALPARWQRWAAHVELTAS